MKKTIFLLLVCLSYSLSAQTITRLLGVSPSDDQLKVFDTASYVVVTTRTITTSLGGVNGMNGLAKKPSTGVFYVVINVGGVRSLGTLNPITGSVTPVGSLGDNFSQITFNGNNTLLGITGTGASTASTVYRINTVNANRSFLQTVNGIYGQVICYNPSDNRVYHWTGGSPYTYNSFDTSFIASTAITPSLNSNEVVGAVYKTANTFVIYDWNSDFLKVNSTGASSILASYSTAGIKGMAYITCSRSITASSPSICAAGGSVSFTMSGVAGATYQWFKNNVAVTGATSQTYAASTAGYFKCRINDGCGTDSLAAGITVSLAASPTVAISGPSVACAGQTIQLTGSTGGTSQWYKNGVLIVGATTTSYIVTSAGLYNMTKTNTNGCKDSAAVGKTVLVSNSPVISVNSGSICTGQSFTIVPTGAATYTIQGGSAVVSPPSTTSYSVVGTSSAGCVSTVIVSSTVTVGASPTISVANGTICAGQSFTLSPSGAATYTFINGGAVVTPSVTSGYSIICTGSNGCPGSNTAVASVVVNAKPVLLVGSTSTVLCAGQGASLTASGASTYTWNTNANGAVIVVSPTTTTTYTVNGTNTNGCNNTLAFTQSVSACTGISNLDGKSGQVQYALYPNPSKGIFVLELTSASSFVISNALGQVIMNDSKTAGKHAVDLEAQPNGIYFIKIVQGNQQKTIKIIKE